MKLFPTELVEYSAEGHFARHWVSSGVIYSSTVGLLAVAFALLPVVRVHVGFQGRGVIAPTLERAEIFSAVSGKIRKVEAYENQSVKEGDIIAILDPGERLDHLGRLTEDIAGLERYLLDLDTLLSLDTTLTLPESGLQSSRYRLDFAGFSGRLQKLDSEIAMNRRLHRRNSELFKRDLVSLESYNSTDHRLKQSLRERQLLVDQQLSNWMEEKITLKMKLNERVTDKEKLSTDIEYHTIRAPVNGAVTQLHNLYEGSVVYPRQALGEISPDTTLRAEVYLSPADIGYIRVGMPARIKIDAYGSREWGVINGHVTSVSQDAILMADTPLFVVHCSLDRSYLELPSGYRGDIRKGMTLQARFLLARRSLLQLLFDSVDNWLNPTWQMEG